MVFGINIPFIFKIILTWKAIFNSWSKTNLNHNFFQSIFKYLSLYGKVYTKKYCETLMQSYRRPRIKPMKLPSSYVLRYINLICGRQYLLWFYSCFSHKPWFVLYSFIQDWKKSDTSLHTMTDPCNIHSSQVNCIVCGFYIIKLYTK